MGKGIGLLLLLIIAGAVYSDYHDEPIVLILNSYEPDHLWTRQEVEAEVSVLRDAFPNADLRIEYMDYKRYPGKANLTVLKDLYHLKYLNLPIDVIIANDNAALEFAVANRKEIFNDAPIVFAGINGFEQVVLQLPERITGVAESIDPGATLRLALQVQPWVTDVHIITDGSLSGKKTRAKVEDAVLHEYSQQVTFSFFEQKSLSEICEAISALDKKHIIYMTYFNQDPDGTYYSHEDGIDMVVAASSVPVYHAYEYSFGRGVVGGQLLSAGAQAAEAAKMAVRILKGEDPDMIEPMTESPCVPMFDYKAIERFGLDLARFPDDAVFINQPESLYQRNAGKIWLAIFLSIIQLAFVTLLTYNTIARRKSERELRQRDEMFSEIASNIPGVVFRFYARPEQDYGLYYVSPRSFDFLGLENEIEGYFDRFVACIPNEERGAFLESVQKAVENFLPWNYEGGFIKPDGELCWIRAMATPIRQGNEILANGVILDITQEKLTDEQVNSLNDELGASVERLQQTLADKEILIRDIHHRVKNNMAIIVNLLQLELVKLKAADEVPEAAAESLSNCVSRVNVLADIYSLLYQSDHSLQAADVKSFFTELAPMIQALHPEFEKVTIDVSISSVTLPVNQVITLGLMANEILSNAYKHAFEPEAEGEILIKLDEQENVCELIIQDNGAGFDKSIDELKKQSNGIRLIEGFVRQLQAKMDISDKNGVKYVIRFAREPGNKEIPLSS